MNKESLHFFSFLSWLVSLVFLALAVYLGYTLARTEETPSAVASMVVVGVLVGTLALTWFYVSATRSKHYHSMMARDGGNSINVRISTKAWRVLCIINTCLAATMILVLPFFIASKLWQDFLWNASPGLQVLVVMLLIALPVIVIGLGITEAWQASKPDTSGRAKSMKRLVHVHTLAFMLVAVGFAGGLMYADDNPYNSVPCDFDANWGRGTEGYTLPAGPHYNPDLDALTGTAADALDVLEKALHAWSYFERHGGYPKEANADYSLYWCDSLHWCPLNPNEISLMATARLGSLYLRMYGLEPNPLYIEQARKAADAIASTQDIRTGGWWERALFDESTGTGKQPDPNNRNGQSHYADGYVLVILEFLLAMHDAEVNEKNHTNAMKYYNSFKRGLENVRDNRIPGGSWNKNSLASIGGYGFGSNLNDETTQNNIRALWLAENAFGGNATLDLPWAREMALEVTAWLVALQGKGGSTSQQGWADQYSVAIPQADFNALHGPDRYYGLGGWDASGGKGNADDYPAWGRAFEPPAMSIRATCGTLDLLYETWIYTGNASYLDAFPAAITWMELPGMQANGTATPDDNVTWYENAWYLYYELGTNVPIMGIDRGGPFSDTPYVYDINTSRCCYGWFPYYNPLYTIGRYNDAQAAGFNHSLAVEWWGQWKDVNAFSFNTAWFNSTAMGYIEALNDDVYWTVKATMYTIKDLQPYVVQLARDAELLSRADVLFKRIYLDL